MTSPAPHNGKIISLEIARFIAAFCIALDHILSSMQSWGEPLPALKLPPATSVLFFFVLSGFVIYSAHHTDFGKLARIPHYFWRRFLRIYPLYWLSLPPILYMVWPGCTHNYLLNIFSLSPLATSQLAEINPPAWTLRFEVSFYLLFGLSLLPYARFVVFPVWIFFVVWEWYPGLLGMHGLGDYMHVNPGINWHVLGVNNIMFFFGLGAAICFARLRLPARLLWLLLVASLALMVYFMWQNNWGVNYPSIPTEPYAAADFGAVIFSFAALEQGGHLRLHLRWAVLGAMSYPLYILHATITFLFGLYFFYVPAAKLHYTPLPLFFLVMSAALAATAAATFLFDRPLQRLARRVF